MIEMPWEWPVDVNYHEAKAYCKWKGNGYRLLTEAEHHRIRGEKVTWIYNRVYCGLFCNFSDVIC